MDQDENSGDQGIISGMLFLLNKPVVLKDLFINDIGASIFVFS